ncbi:ABC transporter ATP-binding protein [Tardisphaera miroshnichenkoae]
MIELSELNMTYGRTKVLDGVSFTVPNGTVVGFVGVNGAGKTTTIKIAAGVLSPVSGTVSIDGKDIKKEKVEASRQIGWVPELPAYEQDARAADYFSYIAGYYGITGQKAKELQASLFEQLGLSGQEKKKLKDYSQGMKKRFALAVSLLNDPNNFLLDEVLNGLDPQGIAFFREKTVELRKEGKAVLFSSHILSEVQNIADEVVFIHRGKIIAVKTVDEITSASKGSGVRVSIANPDAKVKELLGKYGSVSEVSQGTYEVLSFSGAPEDLNAELVKAGYSVSSIERVGGSLESYFLKLIGEQK